jgi:hypothetical protein
MRRIALALGVLLAVSPAFAEDTKPKPAKQQAKCKNKVVGKGLDRKVVCEIEQEIPVPASAAKPKVVVVNPADGRKVTGRPKLTDPLEGLPHRRD